MGAPVPGSYAVGSGQPVYAGRGAFGGMLGGLLIEALVLAGLMTPGTATGLVGGLAINDVVMAGAVTGPPIPAWLTNATVDQWGHWAGTGLTSSTGVIWTGTSPGGFGTTTQLIIAWGDAWVNTNGINIGGTFHAGRSIGLFGGGHTNYWGNEVINLWDFENDIKPQWVRTIDPSVPGVSNVARGGSGQRVSRHTYKSLLHDTTANKMMAMGCSGRANDGFDNGGIGDQLDCAANTWINKDTGAPTYTGGGIGALNLKAAIDTSTRTGWAVGYSNSQRITSFDFPSDSAAS